jgi:hypothetical protein
MGMTTTLETRARALTVTVIGVAILSQSTMDENMGHEDHNSNSNARQENIVKSGLAFDDRLGRKGLTVSIFNVTCC